MTQKICHSADETERTLEKQSIQRSILFRLKLTSYEEGREKANIFFLCNHPKKKKENTKTTLQSSRTFNNFRILTISFTHTKYYNNTINS